MRYKGDIEDVPEVTLTNRGPFWTFWKQITFGGLVKIVRGHYLYDGSSRHNIRLSKSLCQHIMIFFGGCRLAQLGDGVPDHVEDAKPDGGLGVSKASSGIYIYTLD